LAWWQENGEQIYWAHFSRQGQMPLNNCKFCRISFLLPEGDRIGTIDYTLERKLIAANADWAINYFSLADK